MTLSGEIAGETGSTNSMVKTVALRIPADGSGAQLVSVNIKARPHDDGNADFFDNVPDLSPWLGDAFKQRRVSDFHVRNVVDPNSQFPGLIRDNETALHGLMSSTTRSSLPCQSTNAVRITLVSIRLKIDFSGEEIYSSFDMKAS